MSIDLERLFNEVNLPIPDQTDIDLLNKALQKEAVPVPNLAETEQLHRTLATSLALRSSRFRIQVKNERGRMNQRWPNSIRKLYHVLGLVRPQIQLLGWPFWLSSTVVLSMGLLVLPSNTHQSMIPLLVLAPLLAVLSVAYAFRSYSYGVIEWEKSCPISPTQLVLGRLSIIVFYDMLLSSLVSFSLYNRGISASLGILILAWLAPLLALAGLTLILSLRFGQVVATCVGTLAWLLFVFTSHGGINLLHPNTYTLVTYCLLAAAGLVCIVVAAIQSSQWSISYAD